MTSLSHLLSADMFRSLSFAMKAPPCRYSLKTQAGSKISAEGKMGKIKAMTRKTPRNIDDYLSGYPKHVQRLLTQMRLTIKRAAPQATEKISYGIPTFALEGNLVHFAAFKNHIGFYPTPSVISAFSQELSSYKCSKGAVQFPLDEPLPLTLVSRMVEFRVKEKIMKRKKN
jgi:uncharacterized protein YdhG (YjbR/CyaY superfamily)